MKRYLFLLTIVLWSTTTLANKQYDFLNTTITTLASLNESTATVNIELITNKDDKQVKKAVKAYEKSLKKAGKRFQKFSSSKDQLIGSTASAFKELSYDLQEQCKHFIKQQKREDSIPTKEFISSIRRKTKEYSHICIGVCMSLEKRRPRGFKYKQLQFIKLTEDESKHAKTKIRTLFGETATKRRSKYTEKSPIELAARTLYEFLNLQWEYLEK